MSKNTLVALKSFRKQLDNSFFPDGFLLFPNQEKADNFMSMCESMNNVTKKCHYEPYGSVEMNDFVVNKVNTQYNFFVSGLEPYMLSNNTLKVTYLNDSEEEVKIEVKEIVE